jgi:predicted Na+-dependent transporter
LVWVSSILLALMLTLNVLESTPLSIWRSLRENAVSSLGILCLLFLVLPVLQTAAAAALLSDKAYIFGVAAASFAPSALVVPLFLRRNGGDASLGVSIVVASTLLCPLIMVPMLALLGVNEGFLDTRALFLTLLPLTVIPVVFGLLLTSIFPSVRAPLLRAAPALNSGLLGILLFILVGSALPRMPLRLWWNGDAFLLLALMFWMDFGVYWLVRFAWRETAAISVSARNFAIPASLLLFFDPKAALPAALGLVVHALYFQWLMVKRVSSGT